MTPKQLLIAALRSGEFVQICGCLKNKVGCCVLGVAVEVYQRNRPVHLIPLAELPCPYFGDARKDPGAVRFSDGEDSYDGSLPKPCREWYGCDTKGTLKHTVVAPNGYSYTDIMHLNDLAKMTFPQIADVLETNDFATSPREIA